MRRALLLKTAPREDASMREGKIKRSTKETEVAVTVNLDGSGRADVAT